MTQAEINQIKDIIQGCNAGLNSRVESQYAVIETKLDGINEHLKKLNGKVAEHEKAIGDALIERERNRQAQKDFIANRESSCPARKEIEELKTQNKINFSKKGLLITAITALGIIIGIWYSSIKITEHYAAKQIKQVEQIIEQSK